MKIALLTLLCVIASNEPDFVSQQKKYPRVRKRLPRKRGITDPKIKRTQPFVGQPEYSYHGV